MRNRITAALVIGLIFAAWARATEPNETFGTATLLSPGVLSVSDALTAGAVNNPDTLLGIRDIFGSIYFIDDNGSPVGDGKASGVGVVPTNSGSIDFAVSGVGDDSFVGAHSESGAYEVFVDVYDFFDDLIDSFSEVRTLGPGVVHEFSVSDFEWIGGTYDVYIDNTIGAAAADVDFFRFAGLTPGSQFTARTLDPGASGIDTYLGWFASADTVFDTDDDGGGGSLSRIDGSVPAGGTLTFAVTGFGDDGFVGAHGENGTYELRLQLTPAGVAGDYNGNGTVDAADYVVWRNDGPLQNEGASIGMIDGADYTFWRSRFGATSAAGSAMNAAVPEPSALLLLMVAGFAKLASRRRKSILRERREIGFGLLCRKPNASFRLLARL